MSELRRPELHRLSQPFPDKFVAKKEGASYVNHAVVQQRLLGTLGPFTMRIDEVIRGDFPEKVTGKDAKRRTWPAGNNAVVGVVLTCVFTIDGKTVEVSEVGEPEGYYMAAHDGERLKKAVSDALKRCAMRVGVALDLWSKGAYFLPAMLEKDTVAVEAEADAPDESAPDPDAVNVDRETGEIISDSAADGHGEVPSAADHPADGSSRSVGSARDETSSSSAAPSGEGAVPSGGSPSTAVPSPDLSPAQKAKLRTTFMAVCSNVGLEYSRDVRDYLDAQYGASWSQMDAGQQQRLVARLTPSDPAEKVKAQQAFKDAVVGWRASVEGVTA